MSDSDLIAAYIAAHGVTRCPPAYVAPVTGAAPIAEQHDEALVDEYAMRPGETKREHCRRMRLRTWRRCGVAAKSLSRVRRNPLRN